MENSSNDQTAQKKQVILNIYSENGALMDSVPLLDNASYLIGRGDGCDIQCLTGAASLSRQHAELILENGKAIIKDLNSTHGTIVNSKVVQEARISDGDIIQLGSMKFILELPIERGEVSEHKRVTIAKEEKFDFDKELSLLHEKTTAIKQEVAKVIVGQVEIVEGILVCLLSQNHCLLVGVPGLAKTVLVRTFSQILGLDTQRIQFTPDLMPSDIIGSEILKKDLQDMPKLEFVQGPVFTQLLLADEINRTPPKTQAALLEAMQERQVTVAMKSYQLPLPFCVVATQNPVEQEGTYPLPEAQQDRFMLCMYLDYPDLEEEVEIITRTTVGESAKCDVLVNQNDVIRFQRVVSNVGVPQEQVRHAVSITRATRPGSKEADRAKVSEFIDWGAGPRAGQALIRGAKALAAMEGRPAVAADDVRKLVIPVFRHRISCNYRARAEGLSEVDIIKKIMSAQP